MKLLQKIWHHVFFWDTEFNTARNDQYVLWSCYELRTAPNCLN